MIVCIGILYLFRYEHDLGFPVFNTVLLVVLMAITLYPVLNTVAYSFNDGTDAAKAGIHIWPRVFSTDSYKEVMTPQLYKAAGISAAKTIITTALNLFWTGMLAFALSRREYVLRKFITLVMVMTMYVNAGLIPNFLLVSRTLGLHDTFWVYIIPSMFSCFNMIVLRTYIMGLPNELVESARIDGAGDLRIYWQIIFPLCAPVLATVALFVAVGAWNSWFDTMMYNLKTPDLYTLQYYLMIKVQTAGQTSNLANGSIDAANALSRQSVSSRTVQCATTVVTALPILVIYPFLQRYFVTGMALGSVKG
ncbi:MAG: carbohydrate ABC transporter permease [Clostridia bacterium]|nr:carbohydrate ABC transporter permease [Clostridia bacterium]MBR4459434.1 carbohydrate ABC transporter permease [Clostridia bacterium]